MSNRCLSAIAIAALTLTACRPHTVEIAYRPQAGARYAYEVHVESSTTTNLPDQAARKTADEFVLTAGHRVLDAGATGSRVEVRLESPGREPRTFIVRLDRAAQLSEVQRIEGLPAQVLGNLGLSEIFPAAAGAPPRRRLAPGDRWRIDEPVQLAGSERVRLKGEGRLAALGVIDGRDVATIESSVRLPVRSALSEAGRDIVLVGTQRTTMTSTHALADGAVETVEAVTRGRFDLVLQPPEGANVSPVRGTLELEIKSTTKRTD